MKKIRNVLLIPNTSIQIPPDDMKRIIDRWEKGGCKMATLPECAPFLDNRFPAADVSVNPNWDVVCVLGGDGSIIDAAHRFFGLNIPIVGINFGHVGYLAQLEVSDLSLIDRMILGDYTIEERLMLDVEVLAENGELQHEFVVLNDVVLTNGPVARILTFDVCCNRVPLQTCRADGIIVATPTGSTAYSLSAGGPILDPAVEGICLTPICSHTMNSRPVILQGNAEIVINHIFSKSTNVYLTCDGREVITLQPGEIIRITRSPVNTQLIHARDNSFLDAVQRKLSGNT